VHSELVLNGCARESDGKGRETDRRISIPGDPRPTPEPAQPSDRNVYNCSFRTMQKRFGRFCVAWARKCKMRTFQ
jgi:hypothetical protein